MSSTPLSEECDALRETVTQARRWARRMEALAADSPDHQVRADALDLARQLRQALQDAQDTLRAAEAPRAPRQRVVLSALQQGHHA